VSPSISLIDGYHLLSFLYLLLLLLLLLLGDICDYRCLNRIMHIECCEMKCQSKEGPVCSIGKHCSNRALQNREYVKSVIFQEEHMGLGLKAVEFVKKGTLVIEYIGEVTSSFSFLFCVLLFCVLSPFLSFPFLFLPVLSDR
jgi:hypothetical protein